MSQEAVDAAIAAVFRARATAQWHTHDEHMSVRRDDLEMAQRRLRRIALALHQAALELGTSPSARQYELVREAHRNGSWPAVASVTRWLEAQSWNEALVRMRLDPVEDGGAISKNLAQLYTVDEVLRALRECARDLQRTPTVDGYLAWQRQPDVLVRPGRRPAATWIFNRVFGGFGPARVAAGLIEGRPTAAHPTSPRLRSATYRLDDEQILEDIRLAADRIDGPFTATAYERERRRVYNETSERGEARALAGIGTVFRRFGSWAAATEQAAVGDRGRRAHDETPKVGRTRTFTDSDIYAALSRAHDASSAPLTRAAYLAWRERQTAEEASGQARLPSYLTVLRRFGSWSTAVERMLDWRRGRRA